MFFGNVNLISTLLIIVGSLFLLVWVGGFIYANDFWIKTRNEDLKKIQKILIIFPHADDEALSVGGLMQSMTRRQKEVSWIIVTRGEKGTPSGNLDESLKEIRFNEAKKVANLFGIDKLIQKDFPDGEVENQRIKLKNDMKREIHALGPDLIITFDTSGLYGHPDHIVVSEVVTEIADDNPQINLWYVSLPKRLLASISMPEFMAKDVEFKKRRTLPNKKVWVGYDGIISKIKANRTYVSQGGASSKDMPFKFIPMWFYISLTPFEYFHEVN